MVSYPMKRLKYSVSIKSFDRVKNSRLLCRSKYKILTQHKKYIYLSEPKYEMISFCAIAISVNVFLLLILFNIIFTKTFLYK